MYLPMPEKALTVSWENCLHLQECIFAAAANQQNLIFFQRKCILAAEPPTVFCNYGFFQVENPIVYSSFCNGFPTFLSFPNPTNKAAVMQQNYHQIWQFAIQLLFREIKQLLLWSTRNKVEFGICKGIQNVWQVYPKVDQAENLECIFKCKE